MFFCVPKPERRIQLQPLRVSFNVSKRQLLSELHADELTLGVNDIFDQSARLLLTAQAGKRFAFQNIFLRQSRTSNQTCPAICSLGIGRIDPKLHPGEASRDTTEMPLSANLFPLSRV
jgi:hypothetical protein